MSAPTPQPRPANAPNRSRRTRPLLARTPVLGRVHRLRARLARARKVRRARIFFVCGYPKSGTHWVSNLLNLHPEISCKGELHLQRIRKAMLDLRRRPIYYPDKRMRRAVEAAFSRMLRECMVTFNRDKPGALVLGDHSPQPLMGMSSDPTARYLHITRDGRDVLISWTYHWLRARIPQHVPRRLSERYMTSRAALDGTPQRLRRVCLDLLEDEAWVRYGAGQWAARAQTDRAALASAETPLARRTLLVRYEGLHADTEGERRRMYEFLGVDPAKAAPLSVETRTLPGFRDEDPRKQYRRGAMGEWREYFGPDQRRWFDEAAGTELIELGYEPDRSWVHSDAAPAHRVQVPDRRGTGFASPNHHR